MHKPAGKFILKVFMGLILLSALSVQSFSQEVNIAGQLKLIDSCKIEKAAAELQILKREYPKDPAVIYLDALLTKDAGDALAKYQLVSDKFPQCKYADASLYRIYSYYNSQGLYTKARIILEKLKQTYPQSQYLKLADRRSDPAPVVETTPVSGNSGLSLNESPAKNSKIAGRELKDNAKFTIQAGAFLNAENARKLKEILESEGYPASVKIKQVAGSALSVVSAGAFKTESEARSVLALFNEKFKLSGRIVPIDN